MKLVASLRRMFFLSLLVVILLAFIITPFLSIIVQGEASNESYDQNINEKQAKNSLSDKRVISPDWRSRYGDCSNYADSEGLTRVIVYSPDNVKHEKADHIYSKAFKGYSATLTTEEIKTLLNSDASVQIMPDLILNATVSIQYNSTGADILWNQTDGSGNAVKGEGIIVAVIDTGISYSHPDLGAGFGPTYRVIGGYDWVNNDNDPNDDNGHGTHCAGIIGANGTVKGMAPECSFIAYKVLNSGGTGYMSDATLAIERAMDPDDNGDTSDHVDVISMSMGGPGSYDDATCLAVQAAIDVGVVVVVAAGNDGPTFGSVTSPGLALEAITVGSVGQTGTISTFSSRGTQPNMDVKPEICAPGEAIYSTWLYGSWQAQSGTSMATPHVAGACALLLQLHPTWEPYKIKSALVSGVYELPNSLWNVGAGRLWVPNASAVEQFSYPAIGSYGTDYGTNLNITLMNIGSSADFTITSEDWHTLFPNYTLNGTLGSHDVTSLSSVDLGNIVLDTDVAGYINLQVSTPGVALPEGYYSGIINLVNDSYSFAVHFGFAVMSTVSVYAVGLTGNLISDSTGAVYIFNTPDCTITRTKTASSSGTAPPMITHLSSGTYSAYAMGHVDIYSYDDTYLLHQDFTVNRLTDREVYLNLTDARKMTLNLTTEDNHPIYVKEFRYFFRHVGTTNLSADKSSGDYSIEGSEIFSLAKHKYVYVSDTTDSMGIALVGYSYSAPLWDFMESNYDHWYEFVSGTATNFNLVSTTDLQYFLSWEFDNITSDTSTELAIDYSRTIAYETKYNIPGIIYNPYQDWGEHKAMGASASFYVRRDTDTSVEPFFSGINRTTIVQGTHLEYYSAMGLFEGITKPQLYENDWNHLLAASSSVYIPDRNYLTELTGSNTTREIGTGPAYVSGHMENTAVLMKFYHPIFKEVSDTRIDSKSSITATLYKGTSMLGTYSLSEASATPGALKQIAISWGAGTYSWRMTVTPCSTVSTSYTIEWRFTTALADFTPPQITGFELDHRFTPGDSLSVLLESVDDISSVTSSIDWRNGSLDSWHAVSLSEAPAGNFTGSITTLASTATIDLRVNVSDATGNYLSYTVLNYAYAEVDTIFDLRTNWTGNPQIPYTSQEQYLVLTGNLTDSLGSPLHSSAAVPIDLFVDGVKVATILDEYVTTGAHVHNGSIRYEWHFTPTQIFTASGQTKTVTAFFDLGRYEPITVQFDMDSIAGPDIAPIIRLHSPANASAMVNGTLIELEIEDEALISSQTSLDGAANVDLAAPYILDTSDWSEGWHNVTVYATDSNTTSTKIFKFRIDRENPTVSITYPADLGSVYTSESVLVTIYDNSTMNVYWSVDNGVRARDYAPYGLSLSGWSDGWYNVTCMVYDPYGHYATDTVQLYIQSDSPQLTNSPGTIATVSVEYTYNATCTAPDVGITYWQLNTDAAWLLMVSNSTTHCNLSGTPVGEGNFYANLTLNDDDSNDYVNWTITVSGSLPAPTITSTQITGVREDHLYSYDANADQGVTWALNSNATWLSIGSTTGIVSGTPDNSESELSYFANVSCTNANGSDYQNYTVSVYNVAPAFNPDTEIPPTECAVWQTYLFDANHSDEGIGTPPGNFTTIDTNYSGSYSFSSAGELSFTPVDVGTIWFNITADDQRGVTNSTNTLNWTVTVSLGGLHTITSTGGASVNEDSAYSYVLTSNQTVTWGLTTNASFLSLASSTISGTPDNSNANQLFDLNITAMTMNGTVYQNFSLSVLNRAPSISSTPGATVVNGSAYSYNAIADDEGIGIPPGNYTSISTNYSETYSFVEATGVLSFTANLVGSYWFNITFDDQTGAADSTTYQNFTVTITAIPATIPPTPLPDDGDTPQITDEAKAAFSFIIDGDTVYFTDLSYGGVVSWIWNFGDGYGSVSQNPSHRYFASGIYEVSLSVYDSEGKSNTVKTSLEIVLSEDNPVERTDEGWNIYVSENTVLSIKAIGLLVVGAIILLSGMYLTSIPFITPRGRMMIGGILMAIGSYFFIFVDNSWLG